MNKLIELEEKLERKKWGQMTTINDEKWRFKIKKYVTLPQSDYPEKVFVLQEILLPNGKEELRIGYYIIAKKGKRKGKWAWGQFCPFIPKKDLEELIRRAKTKGIL